MTRTGRSFSSRRRRRRPGGIGVIVGGLAALAVVVYGLLWVFGVVGKSDESPASGPEVALTDREQDELRPIGDPIGLTRPSRPAATKPTVRTADEPAGSGEDTQLSREPEMRARRNVLREGLEQSLNGSGSGGAAGGAEAGEVLATDGGDVAADKSAPLEPAQPIDPMSEIEQMIAKGQTLRARAALNEMLHDPSIRDEQAEEVRVRLAALNEDLVFSPRVTAGDPICELYEVQPGDRLSKIAQRRELATHWKLIQRVNKLSDPNKIRVGQKLKLVRGPFHAVVDKSAFRLDIYHGQPNAPESWLYIRSFSVGLGKDDGTPMGTFIVARDSKVENPAWVNPHNTAEQYAASDPANPIGEYWIGLEGKGDASAYTGYGIHGTIEPDSIGEQRSLGCVRLLPDDVALVYELLEEGISVVKIVP